MHVPSDVKGCTLSEWDVLAVVLFCDPVVHNQILWIFSAFNKRILFFEILVQL